MKSYFYLFICGLLSLSACQQKQESNIEEDAETEEVVKEPMTNPSPAYVQEEVKAYLSQWVDSGSIHIPLPKIKEEEVAGDLYAFYHERNFKPAWDEQKSQELLDVLQDLQKEGLSHASFPVEQLRQGQRKAFGPQADARAGARLDLLLSASYLKLAETMAMGKVKPGDFYKSWHIKPETPEALYRHLQKALGEKGVEASLDYFRPQFTQYDQLLGFIQKYRSIVEAGGWPKIADGPVLHPGDSGRRVAQVRERLYMSGDLELVPGRAAEPKLFDELLVEAVKHYQGRNGLEVQPVINAETIAAMNVPAETRLKQILLNLDRIRWFSSGELGETFVLVNIPEYRLRVFEQEKEVKEMKVVVGEAVNATPIFSDYIEYAVFSPYWNVPRSIMEEEIWPKAKENPQYLDRNNYEVLDGWEENARVVPPSQIQWNQPGQYRIRQKPGPTNALGRVKFMFPNDFAIYLHDTPADALFDKQHRAFSHGCIRIEEPAWFADWLFPELNLQEVKHKMNNQKREIVKAPESVPVYIFYLTAFVDEEGKLNFRKDLYELDKKMAAEFDAV